MTTILLTNDAQIQQSYIAPYLYNRLFSYSKVLIVPIISNGYEMYDQVDWEERYAAHTKEADVLTAPFRYFQVRNIRFFNYFANDHIRLGEYDVVMCLGNDMHDIQSVFETVGFAEALATYEGLLIGVGKVCDVLSEMHLFEKVYVMSDFHVDRENIGDMTRMIEVEGKSVIGLVGESAILADETGFEPIGEPVLFNEENVERLYLFLDECA